MRRSQRLGGQLVSEVGNPDGRGRMPNKQLEQFRPAARSCLLNCGVLRIEEPAPATEREGSCAIESRSPWDR
jgi:hypothetical protein